jgi:cytochrome P450 / NADPH-cytochrome P450 reductase
MIAAGTGIAPMRAFLQERAAIKAAGVKKLGPAMLFFGCRNENQDFIYKDELDEWQRQGIVVVFPAFSRPDKGEKQYAHDQLDKNGDRVAELFIAGGKIYLCGSASRLGQSTANACKGIYMKRTGKDQKEADEWLESVKSDRYVSDVY